ncbi:MAG: CRISPR-associated helicase Cas3' [Verrucomicrobia bacterium]|nr:CRISPR-associated helicase Cas3' [Verrucomicrobiota bacterium]
MKFYAHTAEDEKGRTLYTLKNGQQTTVKPRLTDLADEQIGWQPLSTHLVNVAQKASEFAVPFGSEDDAYRVGLLHDLGKYGQAFQLRLRGQGSGINHWTAGAFEAYRARAQAGAFAIDGHHKGIPAFAELQNLLRAYQQGSDLKQFGITETTATLVERARGDGMDLSIGRSTEPFSNCFPSALHTRLLFSCLVDADFLDTEAHFKPAMAAERISIPLRPRESLESLLLLLRTMPGEGDVNRRRRQLLEDCLSKAMLPPGLFTLTAPTGSGKTLASLAFALQHIVNHNHALPETDARRFRRAIVVIPYTTVIEQTAKAYRRPLEWLFGPDYILEHHSAVAPRPVESDRERDAEEARLRRARLAAENWDAPIVVTTTIQFFESLFSNRPSDCRKLHNIARSVVLFDEVQTLPPGLVPSLLSAVNLLVKDFGVTAVFGTATQPAFECAASAIDGGWNPTPVAADADALAETMRRTHIEIAPTDRELTWQEVAAAMLAPEQPRQALCVVNTTKDARTLFQLLKQSPFGAHCFHLSSRMCAAHRQAKLKEICRRLDPDTSAPCLLVSTQLIEAGVDVDFPVVWRALGPLDSIIQSAGRCNREGRSSDARPVYVFRPADGGLPPGAYEIALKRTEAFLAANPGIEEKLHLPETYRSYFACLYRDLGCESSAQDPVYCASKELKFPDAAEACRLIGDETRGVLVPMHDENGSFGSWAGTGIKLIEAIRSQHYLDGKLARQCQRFTVNLYQREFERAEREGAIIPLTPDNTVYAWASKYDEDLGATHHAADDLIV